jgi:ribosomal protein L11 methyltransferase
LDRSSDLGPRASGCGPGAWGLACRFPSDDVSLRDLLAAAIDGTGAVAIDEPFERAWRIFYSSAAARDAARGALGVFCRPRGIAIAPIEVEDDDWARRSQAQLTAVRVGDLIIAPPWDVPRVPEAGYRGPEANTTGPRPPASGLQVIVIEPSMGFGTGHHASTRLCLLALQEVDLRARTVLDAGTGSGVLAIAAAALGAASVLAIDVDPNAVQTARDNVARNASVVGPGCSLADRIDVRVADIASLDATPADVVVANLTAAWLQRHAMALVSRTKSGGILVLAGLQDAEEGRVVEAFAAPASPERRISEEGWSGLVLRVSL